MTDPECQTLPPAEFLATQPDFWSWFEYGQAKGWVSEPDCITHNGLPGMPEDIAEMWDEGLDPCEIAARVNTDNI